ncbi:hypothetical protein XENOCAPTIV_030908, partial [Xenoophorus captivus]
NRTILNLMYPQVSVLDGFVWRSKRLRKLQWKPRTSMPAEILLQQCSAERPDECKDLWNKHRTCIMSWVGSK